MSINPIIAKATIEDMNRVLEDAAEAREENESRAERDADELRELEESQYGAVSGVHAAAPPLARRRSLLDRLLRR